MDAKLAVRQAAAQDRREHWRSLAAALIEVKTRLGLTVCFLKLVLSSTGRVRYTRGRADLGEGLPEPSTHLFAP
ncbi:hypothetical protein ETX26_12830 [Pelagerythrobacter rhizovicinus]|uniref:Uncharacterized protein n=1 Tax=Pelagerythrobacter rhizovicinus TaxID=2268576 RepID=A0A4Q2KHW3_9SPHN|nr:hypothetical protein ETX26_12830 [Pelagerythrobacter rhizovicinus]